MTTDIERQFFETFGIETEERFYCKKGYCNQNPSVKENSLKCRECKNGVYYILPEITDRILLELICILTRWYLDECEPYEITSINIEQLKNQILSNSLYIAKHAKAKHQVQALFKEKNNDR